MVEGYKCYIDTDKVEGSLETLRSLDTCLTNKNLQDSFFEMEDLLNRMNFEHGNFSSSYKEPLTDMEDEIAKIKQEIFELGFGIEKTSQVLTSEREKTVKDIQELSNYYGRNLGEGLPIGNPISVLKIARNDIAEVIASGMQESSQTIPSGGTQEINTLPIGLGIGAAGIVGAIGAVAIDAIRSKNEDHLEDYVPPQEEQVQQEVYQEYETEDFEDPSPYYAIHNREIMSKFYNENENNQSDKENY